MKSMLTNRQVFRWVKMGIVMTLGIVAIDQENAFLKSAGVFVVLSTTILIQAVAWFESRNQ